MRLLLGSGLMNTFIRNEYHVVICSFTLELIVQSWYWENIHCTLCIYLLTLFVNIEFPSPAIKAASEFSLIQSILHPFNEKPHTSCRLNSTTRWRGRVQFLGTLHLLIHPVFISDYILELREDFQSHNNCIFLQIN